LLPFTLSVIPAGFLAFTESEGGGGGAAVAGLFCAATVSTVPAESRSRSTFFLIKGVLIVKWINKNKRPEVRYYQDFYEREFWG
jgi:hypothetical protein